MSAQVRKTLTFAIALENKEDVTMSTEEQNFSQFFKMRFKAGESGAVLINIAGFNLTEAQKAMVVRIDRDVFFGVAL